MSEDVNDNLSDEESDFLAKLSEEDQRKIDQIVEFREKNAKLLDQIYELDRAIPPTVFTNLRIDALLEFLAPEVRISYDLLVEQQMNIILVNGLSQAREEKNSEAGSGLIVP